MRAAARYRQPEPLSAINITPMIDVMLVLIVMMILTIPVMSHKVPIDLPGPGERGPIADQPHRLAIAASGALSWDGRTIADADLPALLEGVTRDPAAVLHMQTDPAARYERFDTVLATVKRANVTRLGFVGDAAHADWDGSAAQ